MSAPRIAIIAGEISGDLLGGAIVRALRERLPQAQIYGVTGPRMQDAGCASIASIDELSVMGIAEVLGALPRILRFRKRLLAQLSAERPDLVIGIDAPDFNLGLERRLRAQGLRTLHVVSPTVWAWRAGRVKGIDAAVDRLLCLFPFEPAFYAAHGMADAVSAAQPKAVYIGHPLADELDPDVAPLTARAALGLPADGSLIAILPGSRGSELKMLASVFAQTAARLAAETPGLRFVTPVAKPSLEAGLRAAIATHAPGVDWTVLAGRSREAMHAADAVLLASGTATLECLLLNRPMVVAYRMAPFTTFLLRTLGMLKTRYVSLPNLLMAEPCVPELLQEAAEPQGLARALAELLSPGGARERQLAQFVAVRTQLRRNAAVRAADAIIALLPAGAR